MISQESNNNPVTDMSSYRPFSQFVRKSYPDAAYLDQADLMFPTADPSFKDQTEVASGIKVDLSQQSPVEVIEVEEQNETQLNDEGEVNDAELVEGAPIE